MSKTNKILSKKTFFNYPTEAEVLKNTIFTSDIYQILCDMKADKNFPTKYHKKAYNHLTKSLKRLGQIVNKTI